MPLPFQWNEKAGRFLGPNGKFIAGQKLRGALDSYLDEKSGWAREWAGQLKRREISLADWQRGMERELIKAHLNAAAMGRGGAAQMDKAALEAAGVFLREELGHLQVLAGKIEAGLPLDGRFLNSVGQYAQAPRAHFHEVKREEKKSRGANQERSVRHAGDSCEDCLYYAGIGWQPLGTTPVPGSTERRCRRKCKCEQEFRTVASPLEETREEDNPHDSRLPATEMTPQRVRNDVQRMRAFLAKQYDLSGLTRRWNGQIEIVSAYEFGASGQLTADGTLRFAAETLSMKNARWNTILHELFHDIEDLDGRDYDRYQGWVEGVLEMNLRQLRGAADRELELGLSDAANQFRDEGHPYQKFVRPLEGLRQALGEAAGTPEDFYALLFETPVSQRANILKEKGKSLSPKQRRHFLRALDGAKKVLGE